MINVEVKTYRDILAEAQMAKIDNMPEDTKELFKESAELSELIQKAKNTIIKDLNKQFER